MTNEESTEAKLLRILIGYFHVSLMNQLALQRHSTYVEKLDQQEREILANDMVAAVAAVAKQATPETIREILSPTPQSPPTVLH